VLTQILALGQARGTLGAFSAPVMAATVKAVMDDLMLQVAADPRVDLDAYAAALVTLFERATATAESVPYQPDEEE
jgi:hypothetical protein